MSSTEDTTEGAPVEMLDNPMVEKDGAAKRMTYKAAKSVLYRHFEGLQPAVLASGVSNQFRLPELP